MLVRALFQCLRFLDDPLHVDRTLLAEFLEAIPPPPAVRKALLSKPLLPPSAPTSSSNYPVPFAPQGQI